MRILILVQNCFITVFMVRSLGGLLMNLIKRKFEPCRFYFLILPYIESGAIVKTCILSFLSKYPFSGPLSQTNGLNIFLSVCVLLSLQMCGPKVSAQYIIEPYCIITEPTSIKFTHKLYFRPEQVDKLFHPYFAKSISSGNYQRRVVCPFQDFNL